MLLSQRYERLSEGRELAERSAECRAQSAERKGKVQYPQSAVTDVVCGLWAVSGLSTVDSRTVELDYSNDYHWDGGIHTA